MRFLEDGIEGGEEFPGSGDEGDFEGFSGGAESFVEGFEDGVVADGVEGGHVESAADYGPSAGDSALPFAGSAIVIERGHASQCGEGAPVTGPQLRQVPEQGGSSAWADALDRAQAGGLGR
jgi:hypothetical protein